MNTKRQEVALQEVDNVNDPLQKEVDDLKQEVKAMKHHHDLSAITAVNARSAIQDYIHESTNAAKELREKIANLKGQDDLLAFQKEQAEVSQRVQQAEETSANHLITGGLDQDTDHIIDEMDTKQREIEELRKDKRKFDRLTEGNVGPVE